MASIWCFRTIPVRLIPPTSAIRFRCCPETSARMSRMEEKVSIQYSILGRLKLIPLIFLVIMPPSALDQLTRLNVEYPMLFKLTNNKINRSTHAGVLEFVADEGKIYIPYWVRLTHYLSILFQVNWRVPSSSVLGDTPPVVPNVWGSHVLFYDVVNLYLVPCKNSSTSSNIISAPTPLGLPLSLSATMYLFWYN